MRFDDYLNHIGIVNNTNPGIKQTPYEKINDLATAATSICQEEIEQIFVSNTESNWRYNPSSIWFFSNKLAINFINSMQSEGGYMRVFPLNIQWLNMEYALYDFQRANANSKLKVSIKFKGLNGEESIHGIALSAESDNCDQLKEIVTNYLKPRTVG